MFVSKFVSNVNKQYFEDMEEYVIYGRKNEYKTSNMSKKNWKVSFQDVYINLNIELKSLDKNTVL